MHPLERFRFSRNHTKENALRCTSSTGSVKVGIALVSVSGRAGHGCRVAAVAAVVLFGHILPGRAQTHSPVWAENRNEVLASEPIRVPRWLSDPVVRAAKATNVDPANILALADKDAERLPVNRAQTASA